ncbi:MAG: preprotein translocase subunit SecA, partial [Schleiferiaceae bacterium]
MLNFISKLVGSKSDRDLKKLQPYVDAVNTHSAELAAMSNDQLRGETESFKAAIKDATASLESEIVALRQQIQQTEDYDAREPLYEQIEALDKQVLETIESVLTDIHPRAFALVRETAKRFTAGSVSVQASELDRTL